MQANDDRPVAGSVPGLPMSRRDLFCRIGGGFGALGLASVLADAGLLIGAGRARRRRARATRRRRSPSIRWRRGRRTSRRGRSGSSSCS